MLNVPVGLYLTDKDTLLVVHAGQYQEIPLPITPYRYTDMDTGLPGEPVRLIGGGSGILYKEEYTSVPRRQFGNKMVAVNDYVLNIIKDYPDTIDSLVSHSSEPYPVFLDIETDSSEEHFSKAERDEILSIQIKYLDTDPIILSQATMTEYEILERCIELLHMSLTGKSPDFVVGYNINKFDIPFIHERLRRNKLKSRFHDVIDKVDGDTDMFYPSWLIPRVPIGTSRPETIETAKGLLNFDLLIHTRVDLALKYLPNKRMKTVATFFQCPAVFDIESEEKGKMRRLLEKSPDTFHQYAVSDIYITEYLYNIYKHRVIASANLLHVPFMMAHRITSGQKSYLNMYRAAREHNFFSFLSNERRYGRFYAKGKYQGALVDCYRHGYFPRIVYLDAASMYPNIMHDMNLSYERYVFEGGIAYEQWSGPIEITVEDMQEGKKKIYIPDDNYREVLIYTVDFENDGFIRKLINNLLKVRKVYKKQAKEYKELQAQARAAGNATDEHHNRELAIMYNSMQNETKVMINSLYGVNGSKQYEIADLPVAIFVTAIGRWIMSMMIQLFGKSVIEVDTDGIILDQDILPMNDIDEINTYLRQRIHEKFGVPIDIMNFTLEFEDEGSAYIYKQKNYIYLPKGETNPEKMVKKGVAFTGYDKAPVFIRAVEIMSQSIMHIGEYADLSFFEAKGIALAIDDLPLEMFKFSKTIKHDVSEYKSYQNIDVYVNKMAGTENGNVLSNMKVRAKEWVTMKFKSDPSLSVKKKLITQCKTEDELSWIMRFIREELSDTQHRESSPSFVLDIVLRQLAKGKKIEVDDTIEYYYTRSSERYSIAEEVTGKDMLNIDKYKEEINKIVDRFHLADPGLADINIFGV